MTQRAAVMSTCVCLIALLASCAAAPQFVQPERKSSDTFIVGLDQKKTVGEPMVERMDLRFYSGFVATSEYQPPSFMGLQLPTVRSGSEWACPRKYEDGSYRCKTDNWGSVSTLGKLQPATGWNLVITPEGRARGYVCDPWDTVTSFSGDQPVAFRMTEVAQSGSFRQELIYNGKSKDTIKIAYREFKDTLARPAFSQDLTYDLSESKEIGFRGMIIEILEATNSSIKFVVRKPMNP